MRNIDLGCEYCAKSPCICQSAAETPSEPFSAAFDKARREYFDSHPSTISHVRNEAIKQEAEQAGWNAIAALAATRSASAAGPRIDKREPTDGEAK